MKLERYLPVGRDCTKEFRCYLIILGLIILSTASFFWEVTEVTGYLAQGRYSVMPPYVEILDTRLWPFPVLTLFCLVYIPLYYKMHMGTSQSHYLMRRLPDRWSLLRRCISLPIATALLTMVVAGVLLVLYFYVYRSATPEGYYQEGVTVK